MKSAIRIILVVFFLFLAACAPTPTATPLPALTATALPTATPIAIATATLAPTAVKPTATIATTPTLTPIATLTPTPTRKIDAATPTLTTEDRITALDKKGVFKFADNQENTRAKAMLADIINSAPYDVTADEIEALVKQYAGQSFRDSWNTRFIDYSGADFDSVFNAVRPRDADFLIQQFISIGSLQTCKGTCWTSNGRVEIGPSELLARQDMEAAVFKELYASRIATFSGRFRISTADLQAFGERMSFAMKLVYISHNHDSVTNLDWYLKQTAERSLTDGFSAK